MAGDRTQRALGSVVTLQRDTFHKGVLAGLWDDEAVPAFAPESSGKGSGKSSVKMPAGNEKSMEKGSLISSLISSRKSSLKIMGLMRQSPEITIPEMAEFIGITGRGVRKQIENLKAQGKLRRIGPNKGGHWEVLPPAPDSAQRGADHGG